MKNFSKLSRAEMKNVLGGDDNLSLEGGGAGQCGTKDNCSTGACTLPCGGSGTCGLSNHGQACTCGGVCAG